MIAMCSARPLSKTTKLIMFANMDTLLCTELIEDKFDTWRGNCEHLVCDLCEKCIKSEEAVT